MKYTLPGTTATFEGRTDGFGEKEWTYPSRRKDQTEVLKKALVECARLTELLALKDKT